MMNSGSFLIMQVLIFVWFYGKQFLLMICVKYSRYSPFRRYGMYLGEYNPRGLKEATLRLFLESYFDISIGCLANIIAWLECEDLGEFALYFSTPADILNSVVTIIVLIGLIYFPIWIFMKVYSNREDLENPEFQEELAWLFEDIRATEMSSALYQFFFILRRLYLAIILTFFPQASIIQVCSFVFLSVL